MQIKEESEIKLAIRDQGPRTTGAPKKEEQSWLSVFEAIYMEWQDQDPVWLFRISR